MLHKLAQWIKRKAIEKIRSISQHMLSEGGYNVTPMIYFTIYVEYGQYIIVTIQNFRRIQFYFMFAMFF